MIGTLDVECQAKNPNLPLAPMTAFINSPSSLRIRNVPKRIGDWCIRNVYVTCVYPDSSIQSVQCVLVGGIWVGTIQGTSTSGTSKNGYTIFADGTDENGNDVTGYVLGKGDVEIMQSSSTPEPEPSTTFVRLQDDGTGAKDGVMYPTESGYVIQQNGEAHQLGTSFEQISAYVDSQVSSKAEISSVPTKTSDLSNDSGFIQQNGMAVIHDLTCNQLVANQAYIAGYATESDLSSKAEVSAVHGDYIQDSAGNKIQADGQISAISTYYTVVAFHSDTLGDFTVENDGVWQNELSNAFITAGLAEGMWDVSAVNVDIGGELKNGIGYFSTSDAEVVWTEGDLVGDQSIAVNVERQVHHATIAGTLATQTWVLEQLSALQARIAALEGN